MDSKSFPCWSFTVCIVLFSSASFLLVYSVDSFIICPNICLLISSVRLSNDLLVCLVISPNAFSNNYGL